MNLIPEDVRKIFEEITGKHPKWCCALLEDGTYCMTFTPESGSSDDLIAIYRIANEQLHKRHNITFKIVGRTVQIDQQNMACLYLLRDEKIDEFTRQHHYAIPGTNVTLDMTFTGGHMGTSTRFSSNDEKYLKWLYEYQKKDSAHYVIWKTDAASPEFCILTC